MTVSPEALADRIERAIIVMLGDEDMAHEPLTSEETATVLAALRSRAPSEEEIDNAICYHVGIGRNEHGFPRLTGTRRAAQAILSLSPSHPPAPGGEPVTPHPYSPLSQHMGDCHVCGHRGDAPHHQPSPAPGEDAQFVAGWVDDAREALKPFAAFADALNEAIPDDIAIGIYADGGMHFGPSGGASVRDLRRALRALSPPVSAWMPISSAPEDVPLLCWCTWDGHGPTEEYSQHVVLTLENGQCFDWDLNKVRREVPTHWMPLPSPPLPADQAGGES